MLTTPMQTPLLPPARITLPILVLGGYAALLVTGYSTESGPIRALPLYIFLTILLLVLQIAISRQQSIVRVLYVLLSSGFAIIYAGERAFGPQTNGNFTKSPYTYIVINILLVIVFVEDVIARRFDGRGNGGSRGFSSLATDFAGLAILFFLSWFILDLLGPQTILHAVGLSNSTPYVTVDLRQALGLANLPSNIALLQDLDLVLGYGAAAVTLLLLGLIGVVSVAGGQAADQTSPQAIEEESASFSGNLRKVLAAAGSGVLLSLRLVLGPLVWLIPAFSIAALAQGITSYLAASARVTSGNVLDLFNPFSATSLQNIPIGLANLAWAAIAIAAVIVSVAVIEHDGAVLRRTLRIFLVGGRALGVTLAFFIYSLAALNAFVLSLTTNKTEPFQVGAAGLIALLVTVAFVAVPTTASKPAEVKVPTPVS